MRSVEKATPALNVPVGDSVADVLGLDAVVLGDGGVLSGAGFMNRRRLCQLTAAILTSDLTTHVWVL